MLGSVPDEGSLHYREHKEKATENKKCYLVHLTMKLKREGMVENLETVIVALHVNLLLVILTRHIIKPVKSQLLYFHSISLLMHLGRQKKLSQVCGPLPSLWAIRIEFLTPDSSLIQCQLLQALGE